MILGCAECNIAVRWNDHIVVNEDGEWSHAWH